MTLSAKHSAWAFIVVGLFLSLNAYAAKEGADRRIAAKLQGMVRQVSAERDKLKVEVANLAAENEQLKADLQAEKQVAEASSTAESRLSNELSSAKSSQEHLQGQVDATRAKLLEVIEKYKIQQQEKNQLTQQFQALQHTQAYSSAELDVCTNKNLELLKTTHAMIEQFNNRGIFETMLDNEPILGFNNVDVENMIQEYQDKLRQHQYRKSSETDFVERAVVDGAAETTESSADIESTETQATSTDETNPAK